MAEAGPSSSAGQSYNNSVTPPAASTVPKSSRIHFPQDRDYGKFGSVRSDSAAGMSALGLGHPPLPRRTTHNDGNSSQGRSLDIRPRVKSVDAGLPAPGPSRARRISEQVGDTSRKVTTTTRKPSRKDRMRTDFSDKSSHVTSATSFSDEYDLDPRIVEDVQRALRLKARREARVRAMQNNTSLRDGSSISDGLTGSSISPHSSPLRSIYPIPPPIVPPPVGLTIESEVDFSPSVGTVPLHPVPASSNGGATLDWAGFSSEEEKLDKRWSISIKRKPKDRTPLPNRTIIEKQDTLYADKLARIRAKAKQHTLRKAEITRDQLQRRYAALLPSTRSATPPDLLSVARWYSKQDAVVQAALDKSEPLTWLKHLLEKHGRETTSRFPWHLTALIIEEYVRSKTRPDTMETIPEDSIVENLASPTSNSVGHSENKSPSSGSWSYTPPRRSLEPSLSRRKTPPDGGQISFEPQVDSGRESIGEEHRVSVDRAKRRMDSTSSPRGSINSSIFYGHWTQNRSPNNSRLHFRELAHRIRRKPYPGSDDGLSSARNSMSEQSQEEEGYRSHSPRKTPRRRIIQLHSDPGTDEDRRALSAELSEAGDVGVSSAGEGPLTAKQQIYSVHSSPQQGDSAGTTSEPTRPTLHRNRKRVSLPSPHQVFEREKEKQQQQANEEQERKEYERKSQLLEDTVLQNYRTRQILQRVGANVREYENVQKSLATLLGVPYVQIPQDVLDAFSHDPSSVVSSTKRFKSWRAVEDIHGRILRQREILRDFVTRTSEQGIQNPSKSFFEDTIASLTQSLDQLELQRQRIVREAETVAEALTRVKVVHGTVKREYNETLGHTSLVYPEMSQLVALEESYRNHYQQLWNIGLDAMTLLLDTVTPFWRNYGKVIGDDVQDFLIIPWYRNEFTGEAKRYPIKSFPRRSFRHCIGLLLFSAAAVLVTLLQIRAAWSSTLNYNLPWIAHTGFRWMFIPLFGIGLIIQWMAVLVEICIVVALFCVVVWWLGWTVKLFS
ncbi:unnamed protein product [Somion occarium]|uniref:Uncharacterized protein n=1 Tax=Somion occarium TaxID=3059160 RepID=A0ABP1CGX4_9APHY